MDSSEWIAFLAVALAAGYLLFRVFVKRSKKKGCCKNGCSEKPEKPE